MVLNGDKRVNIKRNNLIKKLKKEVYNVDIFEEIELAILYGSRAKGNHKNDSDLDLAFLLNKNFFEKIKIVEFRLNLINYFSEAIGLEADVIILNSAKPLLKFQVLKYGELIYVNDNFSYPSYFSKCLKEFFDFKYFREYHYQKMRERLSKSD